MSPRAGQMGLAMRAALGMHQHENVVVSEVDERKEAKEAPDVAAAIGRNDDPGLRKPPLDAAPQLQCRRRLRYVHQHGGGAGTLQRCQIGRQLVPEIGVEEVYEHTAAEVPSGIKVEWLRQRAAAGREVRQRIDVLLDDLRPQHRVHDAIEARGRSVAAASAHFQVVLRSRPTLRTYLGMLPSIPSRVEHARCSDKL